MPYDEGLAHRLRELCETEAGIAEKKMFGGLCFLSGGHMAFGIVGDELMVRVGPDAYEACLAEPHAREMTFTGRAMKGMVYVGTEGFAEDEDLARWASRGLDFAGSLPPKVASDPSAGSTGTRARKHSGSESSPVKKSARKAARKKR